MHIFVKTLRGKTITLEVESSNTIRLINHELFTGDLILCFCICITMEGVEGVVLCLRRAAVLPTSSSLPANPDGYKAAWNFLKGADGGLVPGGFGDRGAEGKIIAAKYARENNIPFLGICLGMQIAVIEFARSVLGLQDANNTEFDANTNSPCVIFMPEGSKTHMGGTMRLGSRRTYFQVSDCTSAKLYGNNSFIDERHRRRYEVNPEMVAAIENAGLSFTGKDESGQRMEICPQTAFIMPLPVIDFVAELLNRDVSSRPLSDADRLKIKKALRGVKVEVTHRGNMRRKYQISGLTTQATRELTFPIDESGKVKRRVR